MKNTHVALSPNGKALLVKARTVFLKEYGDKKPYDYAVIERALQKYVEG